MPRFFWFRFRMLTEMSAFGLFLFGFFSHNPLLTNVGGGVLIAWDILSIWTGALRPGFPIIATLIASLFFTPWWYGAYWVSAAFSVIDIPFYLVWVFRPPMSESGVTSSEGLELADDTLSMSQHGLPPLVQSAKWKPKKNRLYVLGIIVILGASILYFVATNLYGQTLTRVNTPVLKMPEPEAKQLVWKNGSFANHIVSMDYPDGAVIKTDVVGTVEISGKQQGFSLFWADSLMGKDISNVIDSIPSNPDFSDQYNDMMRRNLTKERGSLVMRPLSIDEPTVQNFGQYTAIVVDVVLSVPMESGNEPMRMLIASFDCDMYVCQAQTYKLGDDPFTSAELDQSMHIFSSISFAD